jgi:hypothetical protein
MVSKLFRNGQNFFPGTLPYPLFAVQGHGRRSHRDLGGFGNILDGYGYWRHCTFFIVEAFPRLQSPDKSILSQLFQNFSLEKLRNSRLLSHKLRF